MKVKELIEELSYFDEDMDVHFSYNYGDYWRTTVAPEVCRVGEGFVKWSEYHRLPQLIDEEKVNDEDNETAEPVVILK